MLFRSEATRRRITLISGLLFAIGMGQSVITSFIASSNAANPADTVDTAAIETVDLARGYEIVLEREPNNQTALQGLLEIYLARNQLPEMVDPLEKLIALNPEDETYPQLLKTIKAEIGTNQTPSPEVEAPLP